jgi:GH25 family lysozyme M1 (1,4-beta-N-acetylmuramidase)
MRSVKLPDNRQWWFWQTSESARVNGISEKVDFNVFSGNEWQLKAICK